MILLLVSLAQAARPDEGGGLFHFDATDVLATVDGPGGRVRVHFSVEGPNVTLLDDDDGSGAPDFAELVAERAEAVLALDEALGFRPPLAESEVGLGPLGGSDAFDFYLVDFGGSSDGQFATDRCVDGVCAGHMLMENDFAGYGYPSLSVAIDILTSHELFHGVQAAYNGTQPSWMSEGMAVWAEHAFVPENDDFLGFCSAYMSDLGRSLDSPPAGSVSSFSYGTALFFSFLEEVVATELLVEIQSQMEGRDEDEAAQAIADALAARGTGFEGLWPQFARWNLGSGRRAGAMESYPFASELRGVSAEADGSAIVDDNRFYPLAATYYRLNHAGGPLTWATFEDPAGLHFSLHPVVDGSEDGEVGEALVDWAPSGPGEVALGDLDAGGYWLVGSYPQMADQSVKIAFCLGGAEAMASCEAAEDTGGDSGLDTALDSATPDDAPAGEGGGAKGGCDSGAIGGLGGLSLLLMGLGARRRAG